MFSCPKCRSWRISGPRYEKLPDGGEALRYTCDNCGYSQCEPTADAPPPQEKTDV